MARTIRAHAPSLPGAPAPGTRGREMHDLRSESMLRVHDPSPCSDHAQSRPAPHRALSNWLRATDPSQCSGSLIPAPSHRSVLRPPQPLEANDLGQRTAGRFDHGQTHRPPATTPRGSAQRCRAAGRARAPRRPQVTGDPLFSSPGARPPAATGPRRSLRSLRRRRRHCGRNAARPPVRWFRPARATVDSQ